MYFILGDFFLKIPKNLIASAFFFFFAGADTKKHRHASAKVWHLPTAEANFECCTGET